MCLVCFINAEESRMKKSYKLNINHTDNVNDTDDNDDRNDNQLRNDKHNFNSNHNIPIISSNNNIVDTSVESIKMDDSQSLTAIHYFAIGSMTNVTSIALRELLPIYSKPGILRDHRLLFRGSGKCCM